ncbi:MAG TPA: serine hydrolase [Micromonosporaceae bacterium]
MTADHLADLNDELAEVPGTVSVWCGPVDDPIPAYARLEDEPHYAASTMKVAVLAALYRTAEAGGLDLDAEIPVRNEFVSALDGAGTFGCDQGYDNDDEVWQRVDGTATPRWLARRMITRSSNLATNVLLAAVGLGAVADVWRVCAARTSVVGRGIEDYAARDAGIDNLVTARDLAALLGALATGADPSTVGDGEPLAGPRSCREMLDVLAAQEHRDDLAAGLPDGTRIAHKNGWIDGVRHSAAIVYPTDAPQYTLVVCTTTPLADGSGDGAGGDPACRLLARIAAASWADRQNLGHGVTG